MSLHSWLQNLRSALAPSPSQDRRRQRRSPRAMTQRLNVEALEDRLTPSLQLAGYLPGGSAPWTPPPPIAADVTSDGILDLIDPANCNAIIVHPGRGDGTSGDPIYSAGLTGWDLAAADFNGDGRLDLFSVIPPDEWTNGAQASAVFLGRGDGTFAWNGALFFGYDSPTPDGGRLDVAWFGVTDFDGDGRPDVLVSGLDSGSQQYYTAVLQNDGNWPPVSIPVPSITIGDGSIPEGNAGTVAAAFTVFLSATSTQPITVAYATSDGTATAGSDYQAANGTLTFAPGETRETITVLVNGDRLPEPNEKFSVNLSSPTNASIADGQGVGTIFDDEPRISISDFTKAEGRKNQTTQFTFTVTLSAAYDQPVTMSFQTVNGTATTSDGDYVAKTGTLTFAPGETTKTITIVVNGDSKKEANESFYLDLFGLNSNALFTRSRGLGTILNDD
jgi:hypothetical protein